MVLSNTSCDVKDVKLPQRQSKESRQPKQPKQPKQSQQLQQSKQSKQPQQTQQRQNLQQKQNSTLDKKEVDKCIFNKDENRIGSLIKKGYRVMVLMRGPSGAGKSTLAKSLVANFVDLNNNGYSIGDFVCSSDDFFCDAKGVYRYNSEFIKNAHEINQQKVQDKALSGLSPIFVDNTNTQLWEMMPYVKTAVENNYLLEILELKTPWCNSASSLAKKNQHGVPQNRIQHMLDRYEKCSVATLLAILKNTKYSKPLPQMRSLPPLNVKSNDTNLRKKKTANNGAHNVDIPENTLADNGNNVDTSKSKESVSMPKRSPPKTKKKKKTTVAPTRNVYSLLEQKATSAWKPFESESAQFWGITPTKSVEEKEQLLELNETQRTTSGEKSLLDLLREDNGNVEAMAQDDDDAKGLSTFQRHSVNCPNENTSFATLRQIYPNKRVSGLWDLFVKCNGDVDWVIDILLKEDELERIRGDDDNNYHTEDDDIFKCMCGNFNERSGLSVHVDNDACNSDPVSSEKYLTMLNMAEPKSQRQRLRFNRSGLCNNPALLEVKESIENCFVLGDDQYSEHLLKIKNLRCGIKADVTASPNLAAENYGNFGNQAEVGDEIDDEEDEEDEDEDEDNDDDDDDDEGDEDDDEEDESESNDFKEDMLELSLGEQLVEQLVDIFNNESSLEEQISSTLPLNLKVFMPRSLAKQLYMLWMESAYNYMEEERQKVIREDEDFARLLKHPKYSECKQSPSNLREILDMEYAWNIYNQDKEDSKENKHVPNDLASHLTQMKLSEVFPDIPLETLLDVMETKGNDYYSTVAVLSAATEDKDADRKIATTQERLMECARREQDVINQEVQDQLDQRQQRVNNNNWGDNELKSSLSPAEAKRLALREFEESRNLAAHHCQLKAECYQKAKEAIQRGNSGVANYYSEIANLHKKKIDMYNHRAANCIMDVHINTQNNPELLDLHYLHLIEALGCLDLFLDRHITGLRVASRNYKHVFIITGRGKHSTGGVSTIKNKVKARLKERRLRWSEVNPGLLKVKIFSGSRHSKNI